MTDSPVVLPCGPDELFTATIALMWELWHEAAEHHVAWAADDLLVAISELELGPWRHASEVDPVVGLPFTVRCTLLDAMLAELLRVLADMLRAGAGS